jgi:hypothetical protein
MVTIPPLFKGTIDAKAVLNRNLGDKSIGTIL